MNKAGQHWAKHRDKFTAVNSVKIWGDQAGVADVNVESCFMASHPLNDSDRRMFCQLVEHYTKDVALILQERMGQAAATAHVIDNMAGVIDFFFRETPPQEGGVLLHTAITENARL